MPAASASYAPPRGRARSARAPGAVRAAGRIRWDRLGRIAMLLVLGALVYLYLSAGVRMLSTLHQSHRTSAQVSAMESQHRALVKQHNELSSQSMLEQEARQLGMMRPGEQPYEISNLPGD
jgi:cell division protein FtsB